MRAELVIAFALGVQLRELSCDRRRDELGHRHRVRDAVGRLDRHRRLDDEPRSDPLDATHEPPFRLCQVREETQTCEQLRAEIRLEDILGTGDQLPCSEDLHDLQRLHASTTFEQAGHRRAALRFEIALLLDLGRHRFGALCRLVTEIVRPRIDHPAPARQDLDRLAEDCLDRLLDDLDRPREQHDRRHEHEREHEEDQLDAQLGTEQAALALHDEGDDVANEDADEADREHDQGERERQQEELFGLERGPGLRHTR